LGWPANPTKSGPKKQKRGLVSSLDSLNLELFAKVFAKKSKKKPKIELRQPPTLSHKRLSEKKKITMVKPFARSSGMDILNLAAPPGQSLRDGLAGDPYEGFYLIT